MNLKNDLALSLIESKFDYLDDDMYDATKRIVWYLINTRFSKANILRRTSKYYRITQKQLNTTTTKLFGDDIWLRRNSRINQSIYSSLNN